jgi:DNA-binding transcriptional ArsR family regulator
MSTATPESATSPVRAVNDSLKVLREQRRKLATELAVLDAKIDRYEQAKTMLEHDEKPKRKPRKRGSTNGRKKLDPATVAGPKALKETEATVKGLGRVAQATVTKETGLNSGTVSYALRALKERGIVRATGEVEGRSPVWEYVGDGTGSTKVAPGT